MDELISKKAVIEAIEKARANVGHNLERSIGKSIIEILDDVGEDVGKLPSALGTNLAEVGTDCISRQAAIDIERNATVDTNPSHFEAHQKFTQFMDDAEISSFGRWQWSNGFNTALTAVGIDLKKLPPAQPEIIRCRECKFASGDSRICMKFDHSPIGELDFCSFAERREVTT